jgi:hypothetical protein
MNYAQFFLLYLKNKFYFVFNESFVSVYSIELLYRMNDDMVAQLVYFLLQFCIKIYFTFFILFNKYVKISSIFHYRLIIVNLL